MSNRFDSAKTWHQLEQAAALDQLKLLRTSGCVTVYDLISRPHITITTEIENDDEADRVVRRALEAALDELRRSNS